MLKSSLSGRSFYVKHRIEHSYIHSIETVCLKVVSSVRRGLDCDTFIWHYFSNPIKCHIAYSTIGGDNRNRDKKWNARVNSDNSIIQSDFKTSVDKSHMEILQRNKSKTLRIITKSSWFVTKENIHKDLQIWYVK